MVQRMKGALNWVIEHYVVVCLFLALFTLTPIKSVSAFHISIVSLLLCAIGLSQKKARVDLWIFVAMLVYRLFSMESSLATYGTIRQGYAPLQIIFPIVYLLMAYLDEKELRLLRRLGLVLASIVAMVGLIQFAYCCVVHSVWRLGGLLSNSNSLGIYLVLAWFALLEETSSEEQEHSLWMPILYGIEPLLLVVLALTLSLGSFVSMAVGVLVLLIAQKRRSSWRETFFWLCRLLARASLGVGTGIMIYLGMDKSDTVWLLCPLLLYVLALSVCWGKFLQFLREYRWVSVLLSAGGALVALTAIVIRPSSISTFTERLEMMQNGLGYLFRKPLLGLGPSQWRRWNMLDEKYFNVNHIHNVFLHIGVELGLVAMAMLIILAIRYFWKKKSPAHRAMCAAFIFHNLIDISFFIVPTTLLFIMTTYEPEEKGIEFPGISMKLLFGMFAVLLGYQLFYFFR